MNLEILKFKYEQARERDAFEISLGDTLDVKGSILLAAVAIMASLSVYILGMGGIPPCLREAQIAAIAAMSIGAALTIGQLWPRNYSLDEMPEVYSNWMDSEVEQDAGDLNSAIGKTIQLAIDLANEGISANHKINKLKSALLHAAFYFVAASMALNLGCLLFAVSAMSR